MQVLWIYGTSCVGKSATAWHLYAGWDAAARISYVDIDQLGMCYPASPDDPERDHLKARALHGLIGSLKDVPVDLLIISGIMDPQHLDLYTACDVEVTFVRLRLDAAELERRCLIRWRDEDLVAAILEDARYLEQTERSHPTVDATGLTVPDVARLVLAAAALSTAIRTTSDAPVAFSAPGGKVLVLSGPTAVGKSSVGFHAASALWQAGTKAGYVDVAQLDFFRPPLETRARHAQHARALLAVWQVFHQAGADRLVVSGPFESPQHLSACLDALAGCDITSCRLVADETALRDRLLSRSLPGGPNLAGDHLLGMSAEGRDLVLEQSLSNADVWSGWSEGAVVDTSGQDLGATLVQVLQAAGLLQA